MANSVKTEEKTKGLKGANASSNWFYGLLMAFPIIQFILFYVVVNFKSFGYAFMEQIKVSDTEIVWKFTFDNITRWFSNPNKLTTLLSATSMSLIYYGFTLLVSIPLGLLFSYYIFKKMPLSKMFRVFLFIPSIVPAAAFVLTFKLILNNVTPVIFGHNGFRFDGNELFYVLFYTLYVSFGTSVLMYVNKMFDISPEVIEAGKLDGATGFKEFWHIVLPLTFPTLSVFLVTGVATIFTNQYNLFLIFGNSPSELDSLGYYLYNLAGFSIGKEGDIPNVAALGIILTAVAVPLTFVVKWALDKFGPSEE